MSWLRYQQKTRKNEDEAIDMREHVSMTTDPPILQLAEIVLRAQTWSLPYLLVAIWYILCQRVTWFFLTLFVKLSKQFNCLPDKFPEYQKIWKVRNNSLSLFIPHHAEYSKMIPHFTPFERVLPGMPAWDNESVKHLSWSFTTESSLAQLSGIFQVDFESHVTWKIVPNTLPIYK